MRNQSRDRSLNYLKGILLGSCGLGGGYTGISWLYSTIVEDENDSVSKVLKNIMCSNTGRDWVKYFLLAYFILSIVMILVNRNLLLEMFYTLGLIMNFLMGALDSIRSFFFDQSRGRVETVKRKSDKVEEEKNDQQRTSGVEDISSHPDEDVQIEGLDDNNEFEDNDPNVNPSDPTKERKEGEMDFDEIIDRLANYED